MSDRLPDGENRWAPEGQPEPCHRCGTFAGVEQRFMVTNPMPCLSGSQPKVTGYFTWGCHDCWSLFGERRGG